ncbi:MAG: alpha,alpha-trehalose-phosphate synthase (UDP-forming) [Terriglobia bacterium]
MLLIASLIAATTIVSYLFALYQVRAQKRTLQQEAAARSELLAESLDVSVEPSAEFGSRRELKKLVKGFGKRERLAGVMIYDDRGKVIASNSSQLLQQFNSVPAAVDQAIARNSGAGGFFTLENKYICVYALPLHSKQGLDGALAVFTDASYISAESSAMWRQTFVHILVETFLVVLITLLVIHWAMVGRITKMAQWMQQMRAGKATGPPSVQENMFKPLAQEVTHLARSLVAARAAAEEEARLRAAGDSAWTAERLRILVRSKLEDRRLLAVSNREPYEHIHHGKDIDCIVPASGLVTALEPVLRACDGTWIAYGAGDADRETADEHDRLRVPPADPHYTLRRVWLSKEEVEGYYYGFANEGLWPLCHIAHTRPTFRSEDWAHYQKVNWKFARAAVEEMQGEDRPVVLVQDYHFALLPRLIKQDFPACRVAIFWHIPWPNPEAFGICPWQRELLEGLLGADLIGFHIQSHCNNFLETVDHALESRIDWERFAVNRRGHITLVRPFPISVDFHEKGENSESPGSQSASPPDRNALFRELGVEAAFMGVGVDRVDYTKGILERFRGIERFMEKYPSYRDKFTFVQIGAPSRTHIKRYHDLLADVEAEADRINWRFQTATWRPIVFLKRHHSHAEIECYYKAAHLCLVTSLHDGMNLVSKEFVAARDDDQGVLILSGFTGASRELRDALIVNPYDTEQMASAIYYALEMNPEERSARMRRMRGVVRDHNIYRWAATLISEVAEMRPEKLENNPVILGLHNRNM